ncbi:MAG TPA: response regulator [Sphingobacteriaceae bacterium]|nr:response regulator [Sphingobacteriaceae bacterium]
MKEQCLQQLSQINNMSSQELHFIIVDDSTLDCFITEKIIRNTTICASVKSFAEPLKALEFLETNPFDGIKTVMIVDIYMPLMNGFEFIEAFEKFPEEVRDNYLVYMLSSSINENDMNRVANYQSVKYFLNKPLKIDLLLKLINPD